ncbi:UNKNOWN [Stylonychia lemnae]|uniref:Uncharacterized protein n=1 Tax=Stylonychia lemnae TaxID=5949 RepID=A0A078A6S5_STYLE|nr:UNKNOWN [Stylonychia lemnae]|eukprot:CDW77904.1 UNKNOWN [Stylonychia lemnae]
MHIFRLGHEGQVCSGDYLINGDTSPSPQDDYYIHNLQTINIERQLFFDHFSIEDQEKAHKNKNHFYKLKKQFPDQNHHYNKNIKIIGGFDLNEERFDSDYKKHFVMQWEDYKKKNQPYYQTALAAKQHQQYMEMVHGKKRIERNKSMIDRTKSRANSVISENFNSVVKNSTRNNHSGLKLNQTAVINNKNSTIDLLQQYDNQKHDNALVIGEVNVIPQKMQEVKLIQDYRKNNTIDQTESPQKYIKMDQRYNQSISPQRNENSSDRILPQLERSMINLQQQHNNQTIDLTPIKLNQQMPSNLNLRKDSLPNLGKQRYLQKLFDESYGPSIKPSYEQYRKDPKMYQKEQSISAYQSNGQSKTLINDASVQGIEQIKYYKRLDEQIERQKRIFEKHSSTISSNQIIMEKKKIDDAFTLNFKSSNQYEGGATSSLYGMTKNNVSTAAISKYEIQSQYKDLIDQYKKTSTDQKKRYNSVLKDNSSRRMLESPGLSIGHGLNNDKSQLFQTIYL